MCRQMPVREQLQSLAALQTNDLFLLNRAIYLLNSSTLTIHVTLQPHASYNPRIKVIDQEFIRKYIKF
ncbi:MAG: hypothetical protein ETSY1_20080 [Candidatus Entotheonella factor]|uniref:Uncharacterized protein n=1 Tax=Entotheonella factor TaxID=1429438 RepID=W4LJ33_ENTF1|nr:MAG: hypothetical protein ETSY1_20080 [Candidatus Entotheonella factor]